MTASRGGPLVYGLLLGAFGLGALAGAFAVHRLRRRYGAERVLTVLAGVFGGALLVLGLVPSLLPPVTVALALAGAAWLGSFSTFNIAVQMTTAFWVQARVLALYQATIFGSMAAGSWLWGQVAHVTSLETGYLAAGSLLLLSIALHRRWRLPASEAPDLRPRQLPELKLAFPFDREAGPVMVLIEYRVPLANAAVFVRAMEEVGHVRKRDGAWRWHLFQDTADAEHWYEAFTVASWLHYLRQRRRGTAADEIVLERARRFLDPGFQPLVRRMIARGREMTMTSDDRSERPSGHLEPAIGRRTNIRRLIGQISQSDLPTLYSNLLTEQMSQRWPAVDYTLHAMITGNSSFEVLDEIPDAISGGISSFKMFTTFSGS